MVLEKINQFDDPYTELQVATQTLVTIRHLVEMMKEMTGSVSQLNFGAIPYRKNELMRSLTDNSALIRLGWRPAYSLEQGLNITADSIKHAR